MMNLIAAIVGQPDFDSVRIKISDKTYTDPKTKEVTEGTYLYIGTVINALVSLILVGLVLFLIIKGYNKLRKPPEPAPAQITEIDLLTEIRDTLQSR
jgi:large conductance mechanosensitive channel